MGRKESNKTKWYGILRKTRFQYSVKYDLKTQIRTERFISNLDQNHLTLW